MSGICDDDDYLGVVEFKAGPMTFAQWMKAVDAEVVKITGGLEAADFADWGFADAFEDGVEPRQAAIDMLAEDVTGAAILKTKGLEGEASW